jgi:hypothetical protein
MAGQKERKGKCMAGSDGLSQKRVSKPKKTGDSAQLSDAPDQETLPTEDDSVPDDDDDDAGTGPIRSHSSVIRRSNIIPTPRTTAAQVSPIPQRRTGGQIPRPEQPTTALPTPLTARSYPGKNITKQHVSPGNKLKGKVHWLLPVGIGMIAMLVLWEVGSLVLAWGIARYDDIRYGNPRTFQTDFVVGHGGDSLAHPSHFIAINLNHQAIVIEFPAGNPNGAQSYVVPSYIIGPGADEVPITLEFRDVSGNGKPDMIVHIHLQAQDQTFVFINTGAKFRPPNASDKIHL